MNINDRKVPKIVKYKVIADFPAAKLDVGEEVEVFESTGMVYMVEMNDCSEKYDVRDFPHLFELIKE